MSNPDVSVILPTYNRSDTLPRAIKSVLDQTIDAFELIIVDDGSEENIDEVVARFSDARITLHSHSSNRGTSAAINTGLERARGHVIALIDSDDEWNPRKLKLQLNFLSSSSSDWVAVYCDYLLHTQSKRRWISNKIKNLFSYNYQDVLSGGRELIEDLLMIELDIGGASNLMVRKPVLDNIGGFDEHLRRHTDWDLLIRLLQRGKIGYVDKTLTHRYGEMNCSVDTLIQEKRKFLMKHADLVSSLHKRDVPVVDRHKLTVVKQLLKHHRFSDARRYLGDTNKILLEDLPGLAWALTIGLTKRLLS